MPQTSGYVGHCNAEIRHGRGLSVRQMAARLGVSPTSVANNERGGSFAFTARILDSFGRDAYGARRDGVVRAMLESGVAVGPLMQAFGLTRVAIHAEDGWFKLIAIE